jgi:hydroxypyruvate reductase
MSELKQVARAIFSDALAAIDIPGTMRHKMSRTGSEIRVNSTFVDLSRYERIRAVSVGKASVAMARGLLESLGNERAVEGIIIAPQDAMCQVDGFRTYGAGHPLPTAGSLVAAREVLDLLQKSNDERSIIFFLLSGGGSAMLELPLDPELTLADLRRVYQLLIECGAGIDEVNTVRKHLSAVKGGRLAAAAPTAMKITLGVSDVPIGRETALASGPTLPDPTTIADALSVIERYNLLPNLPQAMRAKLESNFGMQETRKAGDPVYERSHFSLILGEEDLFFHATQSAEAHDCIVICDNSTDDRPVGEAANYLIEKLEQLCSLHPGRRVAIIAGGELSSPVIGNGIGGRNLAFVLDCVEKIAGKKITILSAGTDGRDGSSPAAGAIADGRTLQVAQKAGLDPQEFFQRSDSYNFFRAIGDAIETGRTGINLRDFRILITE